MTEDKSARAANIFDVARLAGVSHQTVSRVLNDLPNVRPATRARVEHAIAQLRYSPSPAARALVTRRTRTIGLVAPGVSDYGPTSIAMHFNFAARAARVQRRDGQRARLRPRGRPRGRSRDCSASASTRSCSSSSTSACSRWCADSTSASRWSRPPSTARRSPLIVSIDQYRGARAAVRHLAELGHTRILHVAGAVRAPDAIERIRGWRDELAAHRLETSTRSHGDWSAASGYRIGGELDIEPGTAVFVANDHMAIGVLSALRERGLRVPEDVSVVGFDDVPEAATSTRR